MLGGIFKRKNSRNGTLTNFQRQKTTVPSYARPYIAALASVAQQRGALLHARRISRGARWVTVEISPSNSRDAVSASRFFSAEIRRALMLTARTDALRVDIRGGLLRFQFQLPQEQWIYYTRRDLARPNYVGVADGSKYVPFSVDDEAMPHSLVVGGSGSGKSTTVASMILALMQTHSPSDIRVAIANPEGEGIYDKFMNEEHLFVQVSSDASNVIGAVHDEFLRRVSAGVANNSRVPRLVLFVDEVLSQRVLGVAKKRSPEQEALVSALVDIAERGRKRRVHLVVAAQRYTIDDMPFAPQLRNRWIGAVDSATASVQLSGVPQIGAQNLSGRGDFLHIPINDIVRFQVAQPTNEDYNGLRRADVARSAPRRIVTKAEQIISQESKRGRPRNRLDNPEILAAYIYYGSRITSSIARARFGLTDYNHRQYKSLATEVRRHLKKYYTK